MFQLRPSDADLYWYLGKVTIGAAVALLSAMAAGVDPIPSSSVDLLFVIGLLELGAITELYSDSTPLYKELDLSSG